MITTQTPREVDEKLAELYDRLAHANQAVASDRDRALSAAGARYYYRGRQYVTDMTRDEAVSILAAKPDEYARSWSRKNSEILAALDASEAARAEILAEARQTEDLYTGWSRFFVVPGGHIHSSRSCSTCRPTTMFGWLPYLSGKTEAEAVEHFGPAAECLCSVCFPSAPVADRNLTQKQTDALLAGERPEAAPVKSYCPGSGQTGQGRRPGGRYAKCPHCGYHGAVTQSGAMRKHQEQAR